MTLCATCVVFQAKSMSSHGRAPPSVFCCGVEGAQALGRTHLGSNPGLAINEPHNFRQMMSHSLQFPSVKVESNSYYLMRLLSALSERMYRKCPV